MDKKLGLFWVVPFLGFAVGYLGAYFFVRQDSIVTPNIIGKGLHDGAEILSKNRLGIRMLREVENSSLPDGIVMDQFPRGGHKIRPNQDIFLTISKKPKTFLAPDFLNMKHKDILTIAAKHGIDLNLAFLFSRYSSNSCIAQNPAPGVGLSGHRSMGIFISKGQFPLFIVPNFKNYRVQDVQSLSAKYNIEFDIVNTTTDSGFDGRVCEQSPIAGSIVSIDRPIRVQLQVE